MNIEKIEQLLQKYLEGETTLDEEKQLKEFFSLEEEVPDHLKSYADQFSYLDNMSEMKTDIDPMTKIEGKAVEKPSSGLSRSIREGGKSSASAGLRGMSIPSKAMIWTLRIAAGIILVLSGLTAGLLLNRSGASDEDIAALQTEIRQMKNALMYSPIQQASASERISAVYKSTKLPQDNQQLDEEITEILVFTMNNDENVNVRLAASEALFRFRDDPGVGKALVHALPRQSDPMMQITLIDMLVEMKEKSAIPEMQKMLIRSETQEIVKKRLEESIAELKV